MTTGRLGPGEKLQLSSAQVAMIVARVLAALPYETLDYIQPQLFQGGLLLSNILELVSSAPELRLTETDQTDPVGRWRNRLVSDVLYLERAGSASWASTLTVNTMNIISGTTDEFLWSHYGRVAVDQTTAFTNTTPGIAGSFTLRAVRTDANTALRGDGLYGEMVVESSNTKNWTAAPVGLAGVEGVLSLLNNTYTVTGAAGFVHLGSADTIGTNATLTNLYGVYLGDATPSGTLTNQYGIYIESLTAGATLNIGVRFGSMTHIFEFPADATDPTGGGGAATGRVPVRIGGATRYLAYY